MFLFRSLPVVAVLIGSALAGTIIPRAQTSCGNQGTPNVRLGNADLIKKGCDPKKSKGYKSSHNCQGKAYLCVTQGVAICISGSQVAKANMENGECFL